MTTAPAARFERRVSWIVIAVGLIAVATVAVGLYGRLVDGKYGTVSAPFVMGWLPDADPLGVVVAVLGCAAVVLVGRWIVEAELPPAAVAVALYALTLAAGLALNVARDGTHGWYEIYDLAGGTAQGHAINEYLPGLPTLEDGVRNYFDRFAEVVPSQSVNVAGHPPGPLLLAHLVGATTAGGLAALVIAIGSLCAPLAYRLGWTLSADERTGRVAGVLCLASPLVLLFGVTSYDYAFAGIGAVAAAGLVARRSGWQAVGLLALAVASLMSWALLAIGAWAVFVRWRRDGFGAAFRIGALSGLTVALLQGALVVGYGYDPIGTLRATEAVYRDSLARVRPYRFWLFGSPVAWGLMLGPFIVAAVIRAASARTAAGLAIVAVVLISAAGGFTKAETERIWLYLVPLACAAAAPYLTPRPATGIGAGSGVASEGGTGDSGTGEGGAGDADGHGPKVEAQTVAQPLVGRRRLTIVLTALVAQALTVQLLFNTVW